MSQYKVSALIVVIWLALLVIALNKDDPAIGALFFVITLFLIILNYINLFGRSKNDN